MKIKLPTVEVDELDREYIGSAMGAKGERLATREEVKAFYALALDFVAANPHTIVDMAKWRVKA